MEILEDLSNLFQNENHQKLFREWISALRKSKLEEKDISHIEQLLWICLEFDQLIGPFKESPGNWIKPWKFIIENFTESDFRKIVLDKSIKTAMKYGKCSHKFGINIEIPGKGGSYYEVNKKDLNLCDLPVGCSSIVALNDNGEIIK